MLSFIAVVVYCNQTVKKVCPNETAFIHCVTNGSSLMWTRSGDENFQIVFTDQDSLDTSSAVETRGILTIKLDGIQPLRSHIEIPYSNEFKDSVFTCQGVGTANVTYKMAGNN